MERKEEGSEEKYTWKCMIHEEYMMKNTWIHENTWMHEYMNTSIYV